jgi:hypothetical protein
MFFASAILIFSGDDCMGKDEVAIRADWAEVLKRRNCIEIYEYLYNIILNEDYALDKKFIVGLLKTAKESDLPCEPAPYGNLKQDIEHYIEAYSNDAA